MTTFVIGDSHCDLCGADLELNDKHNEAKWVPNVGILCGECVKKYERMRKML